MCLHRTLYITSSPRKWRFPEALSGWVKYAVDRSQTVYMKFQTLVNADPVIMKSVTINQLGSCIIRVFGKPVQLVLNRQPKSSELLKTVDNMNVCSGHFNPRYMVLSDDNGNACSGRLYKSDVIEYEGKLHFGTIRANNCHLLVRKGLMRCHNCTLLGNTLVELSPGGSLPLRTERHREAMSHFCFLTN